MAESSPTSMTIDEFADVVSGSVVGPLSERLDALESRLDAVAGRAQLDGLSERLDALSGSAATREDLQTASASLSAQMEEATLQAGELGPVLDEEIGPAVISLMGDLLELWDSDNDGASDLASVVAEIRTGVGEISGALAHPVMSTDFADYTVLEGLLLLLLLWQFVKLWLSALGEGFSWLR